ncbi:hypothetical protein [Gimesia fumaroli]|uniref:Uncharacterized protein n=1 Tax=Gimesia fumaroli TaxID=2527976 RepID=A0A518IJ58_9PLAN|nr:hypothetical protein [Gimesia fumaroli]QDV53139.1 hypothetical protein Enr17x_52100 [Gimesia fumaroli]
MKHLIVPVRLLALLLLLSTSSSGCTSLALSTWDWKGAKNFATPKKPAVEIVALWEAADGKGVDGMPTRGFAGQLLFFQHNNSSPVYVKGEVMIHLYDDQGSANEQNKPIHQYKFDAGAWQVHAVESTLGPAYQVFIPYVRKGRDQAECALRVQLTQKNSPEIYSRMISVKLEGKTPEAAEQPLAQEKPAPKQNVLVETLARRAQGKRLELSSELLESRANQAAEQRNEIQQVSAEVSVPSSDERDERIRRLEQQLSSLLNDQIQAPVERMNSLLQENDTPEQSARYRQFRLNSPSE